MRTHADIAPIATGQSASGQTASQKHPSMARFRTGLRKEPVKLVQEIATGGVQPKKRSHCGCQGPRPRHWPQSQRSGAQRASTADAPDCKSGWREPSASTATMLWSRRPLANHSAVLGPDNAWRIRSAPSPEARLESIAACSRMLSSMKPRYCSALRLVLACRRSFPDSSRKRCVEPGSLAVARRTPDKSRRRKAMQTADNHCRRHAACRQGPGASASSRTFPTCMTSVIAATCAQKPFSPEGKSGRISATRSAKLGPRDDSTLELTGALVS